ncbi:Protein phosphatase 1 regulatory subunit 3B [Eumeta japonica]|uniref:Protein phosphatase 1 regulatory subunit 3B n=1 Tax=Eumeta variegata TaxID=151549 RepID=A0A4C1XNZ0_EUMVA|nr:Protein phosphatase 1 regulatory subunit 3B [Eumeta japonica]
MSTAVEMLASEHFYGHSPPAGFLSDYTPAPLLRQFRSLTLKPVQLKLKPPTRSCLRADAKSTKKKVVFADDKGLVLEHVKFMTEPSNVPPQWALKLTSSPPQERRSVPVDLWEARFKQPASDYLEFRRRITEECVALENVIIKQKEGALEGTVKVKNLGFSKEVFLRTTADGWRTQEDNYCAFLESGPLGSNGSSLYDTFAFRVQLPVHSRKMEFCVCFRCSGCEYWDSNRGQNYVIERHSVRADPAVSCVRFGLGNNWKSRTDTAGNTPYW